MGGTWSSAVSRFVSNIVGNIYPAYASYLAVRSGNAEEHKQWLMYWCETPLRIELHGSIHVLTARRIVNTLALIFELVADQLVSWLPLYFEAKIVFILWLTLPRFKGATYLYEQVVAPYLSEYEGHIDHHLDNIGRAASAGLEHARAAGAQHVREHSVKMLTTIAGLVSPNGSAPVPTLTERSEQEAADDAAPSQHLAEARGRSRSSSKRQSSAVEYDIDADAVSEEDAQELRQRRK